MIAGINYIDWMCSIDQKMAYEKNITKSRIRYACDQCEKSFIGPSGLKMHVNAVHLKLELFKCEKCNKSFNTGSNLNRHVLNKHENIRHQCDFCDANYSQKGDLAQHIKKNHLPE